MLCMSHNHGSLLWPFSAKDLALLLQPEINGCLSALVTNTGPIILSWLSNLVCLLCFFLSNCPCLWILGSGHLSLQHHIYFIKNSTISELSEECMIWDSSTQSKRMCWCGHTILVFTTCNGEQFIVFFQWFTVTVSTRRIYLADKEGLCVGDTLHCTCKPEVKPLNATSMFSFGILDWILLIPLGWICYPLKVCVWYEINQLI